MSRRFKLNKLRTLTASDSTSAAPRQFARPAFKRDLTNTKSTNGAWNVNNAQKSFLEGKKEFIERDASRKAGMKFGGDRGKSSWDDQPDKVYAVGSDRPPKVWQDRKGGGNRPTKSFETGGGSERPVHAWNDRKSYNDRSSSDRSSSMSRGAPRNTDRGSSRPSWGSERTTSGPRGGHRSSSVSSADRPARTWNTGPVSSARSWDNDRGSERQNTWGSDPSSFSPGDRPVRSWNSERTSFAPRDNDRADKGWGGERENDRPARSWNNDRGSERPKTWNSDRSSSTPNGGDRPAKVWTKPSEVEGKKEKMLWFSDPHLLREYIEQKLSQKSHAANPAPILSLIFRHLGAANEHVFHAAIYALIKGGNHSAAWGLFKKMEGVRKEPTKETYTVLFGSLRERAGDATCDSKNRAEYMKEAHEMWEMLEKPSGIHMNAYLSVCGVCAAEGGWIAAWGLYQSDERPKLDLVSYTSLLTMCASGRGVDGYNAAKEIWGDFLVAAEKAEEYEGEGVEGDRRGKALKVDQIIVNQMLLACIRTADLETSREALAIVERWYGLRVDEDCDKEVEEHENTIPLESISTKTMDILIRVANRTKKFDAGKRWFSLLMPDAGSKHGVAPDAICHQSFILLLTEAGEFKAALDHAVKFISRGEVKEFVKGARMNKMHNPHVSIRVQIRTCAAAVASFRRIGRVQTPVSYIEHITEIVKSAGAGLDLASVRHVLYVLEKAEPEVRKIGMGVVEGKMGLIVGAELLGKSKGDWGCKSCGAFNKHGASCYACGTSVLTIGGRGLFPKESKDPVVAGYIEAARAGAWGDVKIGGWKTIARGRDVTRFEGLVLAYQYAKRDGSWSGDDERFTMLKRGLGVYHRDAGGSEVVKSEKRDSGIERGAGQGRSFVYGNNQRSFDRGGASERPRFDREESQARSFDRGESQGRRFDRGSGQERPRFEREERQGRSFDSETSQGRSFDRGASQGRSFDRGESQGRSFDRGDSQGRSFDRGPTPPFRPTFDRGESQGRRFDRGSSQGRSFDRGASREPPSDTDGFKIIS